MDVTRTVSDLLLNQSDSPRDLTHAALRLQMVLFHLKNALLNERCLGSIKDIPFAVPPLVHIFRILNPISF